MSGYNIENHPLMINDLNLNERVQTGMYVKTRIGAGHTGPHRSGRPNPVSSMYDLNRPGPYHPNLTPSFPPIERPQYAIPVSQLAQIDNRIVQLQGQLEALQQQRNSLL